MPISKQLWKALRDEFTAWYEVSELPESWPEWMAHDLEGETNASATRIRRRLSSSTDVTAAVTLLRRASQERRGELVREIEDWTRFGWGDEDADWAALQRILNAIADRLV